MRGGGASLWLARNTQARYTGITISSAHAKDAVLNAKKLLVNQRISFCEMDFFRMAFSASSIDKVFAIESVSTTYPAPLKLFLEMNRVLKPGGMILISDGFLSRQPVGDYEEKLADNFAKGFSMGGWCIREDIMDYLEKAGFINIKFTDKTDQIKPTVRELFRIGIFTLPLHVLRLFGLVSRQEAQNTLAVFAQKRMYDLGLFRYGIFYAEKSK